MNPLEVSQARSQLYQDIRRFFDQRDFVEVETPILTPTPGMEPHLDPFETKFQGKLHGDTQQLYLNHSPELYMKRLLGLPDFQKIYQITKVFRNGELGGPHHNPEFTMLEWYRKDADYTDLMEDCEQLFSQLLSIEPPFPRKSTRELFLEHTGIDLLENRTHTEFAESAKQYDINQCPTWDDIFFKIFLNEIEPKLPSGPLFITDYPASQAALARLKPDEPFFAERFELYIDGIELANAFSELIDPDEQRQRLQQEQQERAEMGKPVLPIDEKFLEALGEIDSPTAGIALGVDRLLMLVTGSKNLQEISLFNDLQP